jgi:ankyrin repeat protein
MRDFNPKLFAVAAAALLLLFVRAPVREHRVQTAITADEFMRAVATHRASLIDSYFRQNLDPNARGAFDSPLMVAAAEQSDWGVVRRLIDAGASVDLADKDNFTPLMAAAAQGKIDILRELIGRVNNLGAVDGSGRTALQYAIISGNTEALNILLAVQPVVEDSQGQLLETALGSGSATIVGAIAERLPVMRDWTAGTRRALHAAIESGDRDLVRLLLKKHAAPPTPEGKNVPLLAYAIA